MTDLTSLSGGFATIGQGAGPMMVTWSAGLFAKHGLAIERPRIMGGAKGVVRGLMSGEIQFGNMAAPAPLRANLKGEADVVFLTGGINQQFIMGRPGINSRQELGGKKIGFVGDGGLNDALVRFVIAQLHAAGIQGLREETILGGGNTELEALLRGRCDAIVSTPPECIDAQRKGCSYLIDFAEYGLNYALGGIAAGAITLRRIRRSRGGLSRPTSKACTAIVPIASLRSESRRSTAGSRIVQSRKKPTISPNRACRACRIPSSLHCKRYSISWRENCQRQKMPTRGVLSMSDLFASSTRMDSLLRYPIEVEP